MNSENKHLCPHCKAPIQENAAFCLHCMKSLDSKTVIEKAKPKKPFIIAVICAAVLILGVVLFLICYPFKKNNKGASKKSVSAIFTASETADNSGTTEQTKSTPAKTTSKNSKTSSGGKSAETGSNKTAAAQNETGETNNNTHTEKPADTPTHKHTYTSKVTKPATCGSDGEKKYTCSCGAYYVEKISATGNHNWTEITKTVHHDEQGHYETVKTADAYTWYECPQCSEVFKSLDAYYNHFDTVHVPTDPFIQFIRDSYIHGTEHAQYEEKWIVDSPAYDEKVITGYKCSVCGKTK